MSIERLERKNGHVYRVRWRDEHGQAHSRVVGRKRDAEILDSELKRSKRLGATAPINTSTETLEEFAKLWWPATSHRTWRDTRRPTMRRRSTST
jgi:hypothetical protein